MIPQIIHSVWFGRGEKKEPFASCIENQKRFCRDNGWWFREVNEDNVGDDLMQTPFMRGVLARGEWTKATVVGRYSALAALGGTYLDCDVEIVKPFGALMDLPFFAGWEDANYVCDAVIGSVPAWSWRGTMIARLLHDLPLATSGELGAHQYGPAYLTNRLSYVDKTAIQPVEVFYPSHYATPDDVKITDRTVTHHRWAGSWIGKGTS